MKPTQDTTPSLRQLPRVEGLSLTGTLLALGQIAASSASAATEPEAKGDKPAEKVEELPGMVVEAKTGKTLYKPENLASPKYVKPLRDVAQTVTVVPKEVIQEQGATTLAEILRNVPGITMQSGENGNAAVNTGGGFTLRGFDANNSIFTNGVRDVGYISRDTFNTESAEVFQGPTGSDVGRGNGAGYVNLQTKTPHLGNSYEASAGYFSGDRQRYTADLNQQLPDNWISGAALRLNGMYQDGGVAGRDVVERNSWGIAPSLAFGLGTDTRLTLAFQRVEEDNIPDYGLPAYLGRPLPQAGHDTFYGNITDHEDLTQSLFLAKIEHDFNEHFTLRNQTVYIQNGADINGLNPQYSHTTGLVTLQRQANGIKDFDTFSNQTTLTAKFDTGFLKHSLVSGFEYTREEQEVHAYLNSAVAVVPALSPPYIPNPYQSIALPDVDPNALQYARTNTTGLYVFDNIDIGKHFILSGGLRRDDYDVEYFSRATGTGTVSGSFRGSEDIYSGKVGLTYKPVEEGSIYVAYSNTKTPPGTAAISEGAGVTGTTGNTTTDPNGTPTSNNNFNSRPQVSENWELGAKWEFLKSKLLVSGAVFHTENTNVIYQNNPGETPATYAVDGGQTVNGFTLGAAGQITENWQILANGTYLDATLDQPGAKAANINGVANSIYIDGNRLARTPELSGSLWTTYKLPKGFTVGMGVRYQDSTYLTTANTLSIPAFAVVDAMVQYQATDNVNVRLNVYNLLDREYIATSGGGGGGGGGNSTSGGHALYGSPLSLGITTTVKF